MSVLDEKNMLDLLKNQVNNMSHMLKEAETGGEKMSPIWFLLMHYEAAEIQMAIEYYIKQEKGKDFEIIKAMQEAQIAGLEKEIKAEKKRIVMERECAEKIDNCRCNWLGEVQE